LTAKNISAENAIITNQDIFVPLSMPFENYIDANGNILSNVLPNIDTPGFIDTRTSTDIANGVQAYDIYTDWSSTSLNSAVQVIDVPIRAALIENVSNLASTVASTSSRVVNLANITVYPDDVNATVPTYNKTSVIVTTGTTTKTLVYNANSNGFVVNSVNQITIKTKLSAGDIVTVQCDVTCGSYTILNGIKPSIMVQLYVDNTNQNSIINLPFSVAKSSLTTTNNIYTAANSTMYLTTNGYTLVDPAQVSSVTGDVYKIVTNATYTSSPIKGELFNLDRHLNLAYSSPNFAVTKNVIPRLKRVLFI